MKNIIGLFIAILLFTPVLKAEDDCISCANTLQVIDRGLEQNINALNQVSEANKVRVDLIEAKISYGMLGIGAGRAKIYLTVSDGKLVDLNIDARVGVLGINSDISQKVTIDRLKRGQPLEFFMDGAAQPTLRVRPGQGFNEAGGVATVEIWNGRSYDKETINISKNLGNQYKIYHGNVARTNEVTGLSINVRGMSVSSMYVGGYKIETR
ncbi:MAG: hypothetical protein CME71_06950 [Halobacteriovorax sp.]|nr:hypothetical protein [Halobacteriovorax sp.]|tara:strand:- start:960 stop:1589 length:630 start_codon:yes stop_codon:yes gene_type:complete